MSPQRIVFACAADLRACVAAAIADPELDVVRVKNSLDKDLDARPAAGFRSRSPFRAHIQMRQHTRMHKLSTARTHPQRCERAHAVRS